MNESAWDEESREGETKCNRELSMLRSHREAWPQCSAWRIMSARAASILHF